jgi:ribokinase
LADPRIVVVGSYATGLTMSVQRLPRPGETVLGSGYRVDYGGKGSNQAVGCSRLGAHVSFVARIGNDAFGQMALGLYKAEKIDTAFILQSADHPTGVGFILVEADTANNCIALDPGANELLSPADVASCERSFEDAAVVLAQLETPVATAEAALAHGRACGAITILNPAPVRPSPESVLRQVDVLTPNRTEASVLTGRTSDCDVAPDALARDLIKMGVKAVIVTLGEAGALLVTGQSSKLIPAVPVKAVDTTGAGDAFNAGLATALAYGESLDAAAEFAVVTAALAVTRHGVIPSLPGREEVMQLYQQRGVTPPKWVLSSEPGRNG